MEVTFECPYCDAEIKAEASASQGRATCPSCYEVVLIPAAGIKPGMKLGDFRIERCLGVGGMGEVFLAVQEAMDRQVALKVLPPAVTGNKSLVNRFLQEARMAGKLEHPNVVTAFYAGQDAGYYYLAMSYVEGVDLEHRIKDEGRLSEIESLNICLMVAKALDYAWQKHHLLHRDIKPANIMIAKDGEVKLMDMGIAKAVSEDSGLTMAGVMLGTPFYMSPEQAKNTGDMDCRTDIYALGGTLFHLVTGRRPFEGPTAISVVAKHLNDPVPIASAVCADVSPECAQLIGRMMAKDPNQRPKDWQEMISAIETTLAIKNPGTLELKVTESQEEILAGPRQPSAAGPAMTSSTIGIKGTLPGAPALTQQMPPAPARANPTTGISPNDTMSDYMRALPANPPVPTSLKVGLLAILILGISLLGVWIYRGAMDERRQQENDQLQKELALKEAALKEKKTVNSIEEGLAFHVARGEEEVKQRAHLKQLEEMINLTQAFDEKYPDQIERTIGKYLKIQQEAKGTKYSLVIDDRIENLRYRLGRVSKLQPALQGSWYTKRGSSPVILLTLNADNTFSVTHNGKTTTGAYGLSPDALHLYQGEDPLATWPLSLQNNGQLLELTIKTSTVQLRHTQ